MTTRLIHRPGRLFAILASLALAAGLPLGANAHDDDIVDKVKIKDHKVVVKVEGGRAKIKQKRNGRTKVRVRGPNGDIARSIARDIAGHPQGCPAKSPRRRYGK